MTHFENARKTSGIIILPLFGFGLIVPVKKMRNLKASKIDTAVSSAT
jgi:hypothetical protein